jgi:ABC-type uncharacterized transport system substrate-binding protein
MGAQMLRVVLALTFALIATPLVGEAQQTGRTYRMGFLENGTADNRVRIIDFALANHLPVAVTHSELVDSGALLSYGANYPDLHRGAARYVDRILKGAGAGDLPIEQPVKFELVLNLKTAKTLGLIIPSPLLLRADRVVE